MEEKDPMLKQVRAKVDDKNHEVLYKSPGPERGENGRTFAWIGVKTKEEAAKLIADGWSISQEEAYELEDALKAGKKGKKRLVRTDVEEDEEEAEAEEESNEQEAEGDEEEDPILKKPSKSSVKSKKKGKK